MNLQRYPVLIGALAGAVLLPMAQVAVSYGYFSLLPRLISSIFLSPENLLLGAVQKVPAGILLGSLTGSLLAAWRANNVSRLNRDTRWSFIAAFLIIVWMVFVNAYLYASGDNPIEVSRQFLIGSDSIPILLRFIFLSLALNISLF